MICRAVPLLASERGTQPGVSDAFANHARLILVVPLVPFEMRCTVEVTDVCNPVRVRVEKRTTVACLFRNRRNAFGTSGTITIDRQHRFSFWRNATEVHTMSWMGSGSRWNGAARDQNDLIRSILFQRHVYYRTVFTVSSIRF